MLLEKQLTKLPDKTNTGKIQAAQDHLETHWTSSEHILLTSLRQ